MPDSSRIIIYCFVAPAAVVGLLVWGVVFFLSPMRRGERVGTELRGAHLVWWAAWALSMVGAFSGWFLDVPGWLYGGLVAVAIGGAVAKVVVLDIAHRALIWYAFEDSGERYEERRRYYLFWSKGPLPVAIALSPGALYVLWWLASHGGGGHP